MPNWVGIGVTRYSQAPTCRSLVIPKRSAKGLIHGGVGRSLGEEATELARVRSAEHEEPRQANGRRGEAHSPPKQRQRLPRRGIMVAAL